jgi:hypothetical protein
MRPNLGHETEAQDKRAYLLSRKQLGGDPAKWSFSPEVESAGGQPRVKLIRRGHRGIRPSRLHEKFKSAATRISDPPRLEY